MRRLGAFALCLFRFAMNALVGALVLMGLPVAAQTVVRITADNFYGVYTGSSSSANTMHFSGALPTVTPGPIVPNGSFLYVVVWDDGSVFQGFLGSVAVGPGLVTTGSPLWTVCATNQPLANAANAAPSTTALTLRIATCNNNSAWHAPSVGPNNGNAANIQVNNINLWGMVGSIDATASWIWDTNSSPQCAGPNGFLNGTCNPGEFLIFRISLDKVRGCPPPVPDFVIDCTAGYGALVADGSNSQNEANHFWSIEKSDQWWNRFPPEIMQWFSGTAGVFDLRTFYEQGSGQRLTCDTYYRVKLAVSNQCIGWRETSRLVKLNCCQCDVTSAAKPPEH